MNDQYSILVSGQLLETNADMNRVSEVCDDLRYLGFSTCTTIDSDGNAETIRIQPVTA